MGLINVVTRFHEDLNCLNRKSFLSVGAIFSCTVGAAHRSADRCNPMG